jgi:hypothetical protein
VREIPGLSVQSTTEIPVSSNSLNG